MSPQVWESLITLENVLDLYAEGIRKYGGDASPPKDGCLEQSLGNAYTAELYTEAEAAMRGLCFCAYLLFYLARNHCFSDGNKRVAWTSTMRVLLALGLTVNVSDEEAEAFCLRIADSTAANAVQDGSEVTTWIAERLQSVN